MGLLTSLKSVLRSKTGRLNVKKRFKLETRKIIGSASEFRVAVDLVSGERFGLKLLDAKKTELFRNRFKGLKLPQEGEIGSLIDHPHVCKTLEYGHTTDGQQYLLLELLEGHRLDEVVSRKLIKRVRDKLKVVVQMANAIQAVHDAQFIHRDICPRNFLLDKPNKTLKLIDFGISVPNQTEFCQAKNRTGTPLYMSTLGEVARLRTISGAM